MVRYRCNVCNVFEYEPKHGNSLTGIKPGTEIEDFPDDWHCPVCFSDKSHLKPILKADHEGEIVHGKMTCPVCGAEADVNLVHPEKTKSDSYLGEWRREKDDMEIYMQDIHLMASTGESLIEPMRTQKAVVSWDDILIKAAQIARIPLNKDVEVNTRTVIGPGARHPLVIGIPVYITHMSFGALSREAKIALARGSAAMKTAFCSGEGGILEDARREAYRYILEYVPNRYSITDENLASADAVEIKLGQSAVPGLGAHLPAEKVTDEIARIRGYPQGTDILSPAHFEDIRSGEELRVKVSWLREKTGGKPVGVKTAAGNIEGDLEAIVFAEPDFITIDGRPGSSAAAPKYIKDSTSVPTIFALHRARKFLDRNAGREISLVITGGLRISPDFSKALAMGADAVAIGTAALIACGCQQYRRCSTGKCPVGITTQNPELRKRLEIDISARKLELFLQVCTRELHEFSRLTGNSDVHAMSISDLCTTNSEISDHTSIPHV